MLKPVIGLEIHTELNTNSKMFSSSKNEYTKEVNNNISEIDLAFPGTLPLPNKEAVKKAIKLALSLNCEVPDYVMFDRKNYYYADLPKGYQITQMTKPFGKNGYLDVSVNGEIKRCFIHQIHLEEDSASMEHISDYSLIDYNRAGIPLVEIVTEPIFYSIEEVISFLENLRLILKYIDVSNASSEKGELRVDVNISMKEESSSVLGTRAEIKNINSFNNVKEVIAYEINRQTELLESGKEVIQETRRWIDDKKVTEGMRAKVDAIDYRYFVEPNIPVVKLDKDYIDEIKSSIVSLPLERMNHYISLGVSEKDAKTIIKDKSISDYFEYIINNSEYSKEASNWITTKLLGYMNEHEISINEVNMTPEYLINLIDLVKTNKISSEQAKEVFNLVLEENKSPFAIVKEHNMEQVSDEDAIRDMVKEVIKNNTNQYESYKNGKTNLLGFFVGQTLKLSSGKANPSIVNKIVNEELNK